jgi:hypothetical protein
MLLCCKELRGPIKRFIREQCPDDDDDTSNSTASATDKYDPLADKLTDEEWDEVEELVNFLQAPYKACKLLEGDLGTSGHRSI